MIIISVKFTAITRVQKHIKTLQIKSQQLSTCITTQKNECITIKN